MNTPTTKASQYLTEMLLDESCLMRRPIIYSIVDGKAYAAAWPFLSRRGGSTPQRDTLVIREDGTVFRNYGGTWSDSDREELEFNVNLNVVPPARHLWSTKSVKAFLSGKRPQPVDVFRRIYEVVDHYIDFNEHLVDQRAMSELIACYIIATWCLDAFQTMPLLWVNGENGSGKSQLLSTITQMAFLGEVARSQSTFASLRDALDYGATIAIDDADEAAPDLLAILLASNRRGSVVTFKEQETTSPAGWRTQHVNCFGPRLFTSICLPHSTLNSHTIVIPLRRSGDEFKTNRMVEATEGWPHDRQKIIDDLWAVALSHLPTIRRFAGTKLSDETDFTSRRFARWQPILAIAAWLDDAGETEGVWDRVYGLASNNESDLPEATTEPPKKESRHEAESSNKRKDEAHVFRISDYEKLSIELVTEHDRRIAEIAFDRGDDNRFEVNLIGASGDSQTTFVQFHLPG